MKNGGVGVWVCKSCTKPCRLEIAYEIFIAEKARMEPKKCPLGFSTIAANWKKEKENDV
jgi:hypothetical protein